MSGLMETYINVFVRMIMLVCVCVCVVTEIMLMLRLINLQRHKLTQVASSSCLFRY